MTSVAQAGGAERSAADAAASAGSLALPLGDATVADAMHALILP